ncbi:peptide deformylase, partial [Klebsiella pneumoniae]|nr:peptide deformylase [Klebsiella pneumoniae]
MALLPILSFPDPRLRTIAKPVEEVTDEIRQLAADMFETMYAAPGIGLAASQVDRHIQLIVMDLSDSKDEPMVFINPQVTPLTEVTQPYE